MPSTAIVWLRRDLRLHDHPALDAAARDHDHVVALYVLDPFFDPATGAARYRSEPRAAYLHGCLHALDARLRERGGALTVRRGDPRSVVPALAAELDARTVLWTSDVSAFARARDRAVTEALLADGRQARPSSGTYVTDPSRLTTKQGAPFTVFSPFHRAWAQAERRSVLKAPDRLAAPPGLDHGELPGAPRPDAGEPAAQAAAERFLAGPIDRYHDTSNLVAGGSSELSPHLRWGTVSPRALEERALARGGRGADAFRRQLGWRDFYAHVLLHGIGSRRPDPDWEPDDAGARLAAWQEGRTGYPLVDAGMRQLASSHWMHNRARLVTGSFLTKDLHLDWRLGEEHFARLLLDGEPAQNDGNWRWVASVGVDPAPAYRRMFNPTLQQRKFDPDGAYVRRWVPELRDVPLPRLFEPWTMDLAEQAAAGCVIGQDYPEPIVDHQHERRRALELYAG
ncbi:MAG TPA: deoxyribodipyrimidine photo-lyase [Capillimicrobium sp.]